MPLEKFDSSAADIITKNKRFDRYFLPYPDKATEITTAQRKLIEQKTREARIHMTTIMSSSNCFFFGTDILIGGIINCSRFSQKKGGDY